jgi:flavocytochrome c
MPHDAKHPLLVDVAVIGSGGAGLAAALEASKAGARVAIIEKADTLGGASALSGGGCCMVGTPLQEQSGIHDSPDLAFEDWVKWGQGAADEPWARYYVEHSLHELYFWCERLGVTWLSLLQQEGNRVARWHRPRNHGLGIVEAILQALEKLGMPQVFTSTMATKLVMDAGKVCGVQARDTRSGEMLEIRSRSLVLASGGVASNLRKILELRPDLKQSRILLGGGPGATGDGHRLATEIGAYLTHLEQVWFYAYATPDYRDPAGERGLVFRLREDHIWVNQQGQRFHDESRNGGASATPAVLRQNPQHAWAVFDAAMCASMEIADPYYRKGSEVIRERIDELFARSPYARQAGSLEGLARAMDVDGPVFLENVERYNQACAEGRERDPAFGKPLKGSKPLATPPFYALQMFPLARKSLGGIKTDLRCRVMSRYFEPVAGLYAAGEVAGMAGGHINGKAGLEGTMLGPSLFSGRVAGAWAAHEAGFGRGFIGKPNRPESGAQLSDRSIHRAVEASGGP